MPHSTSNAINSISLNTKNVAHNASAQRSTTLIHRSENLRGCLV